MLASPYSIDIIIPTFRPDERILLPLIRLSKPEGWQFNYYIIVDNPQGRPGEALKQLAEQGLIHLIINEKNLGPGETRNKGIDQGTGEWILCLDDDVTADEDLLLQYVKGIEQHPDAIGFIGLIDFPPPFNAFTEALDAAGLTTVSTIARKKDRFPWGGTANIMYRRSAMQGLRFDAELSKFGAGEDKALGAQMSIQNNSSFVCLKDARILHPWFNDGQPNYRRFARYGGVLVLLAPRFKKYCWYAFPNPVESIVLFLLAAPLLLLFLTWQKWLLLLLAVPFIELLINYGKARAAGYNSIKVAWYMTLLKGCSDWSILKTAAQKGRIASFMQRINSDFAPPHHFRTNRWRIIKLILFIIVFTLLIIY